MLFGNLWRNIYILIVWSASSDLCPYYSFTNDLEYSIICWSMIEDEIPPNYKIDAFGTDRA